MGSALVQPVHFFTKPIRQLSLLTFRTNRGSERHVPNSSLVPVTDLATITACSAQGQCHHKSTERVVIVEYWKTTSILVTIPWSKEIITLQQCTSTPPSPRDTTCKRFCVMYKANVISTEGWRVFLLGVRTVLRLERYACSMVKRRRRAINEYAPPLPSPQSEAHSSLQHILWHPF